MTDTFTFYGVRTDGTAQGNIVSARCINSEPGTFNHECGKPANNIGADKKGNRYMFCDHCRAHGYEAKGLQWAKLS